MEEKKTEKCQKKEKQNKDEAPKSEKEAKIDEKITKKWREMD